jgi:putative transposase
VDRYEFVKKEQINYPTKIICKVLNINRSSYYEYVNGQIHNRITESGLSDELCRVFQANKRRRGSRRLKVKMQEMGYKVGRIRKLLKEQGLKAIQPHSFVPKTTQSKHGLVACPNLLGIGFEVVRPNQAKCITTVIADIRL